MHDTEIQNRIEDLENSLKRRARVLEGRVGFPVTTRVDPFLWTSEEMISARVGCLMIQSTIVIPTKNLDLAAIAWMEADIFLEIEVLLMKEGARALSGKTPE